VPLETRGAIARYDATRDVLELHGRPSARIRTAICCAHGWAKPSSVTSECHIGGGFGVRGEIYPEDVLVCAAALKLGRAVKWIRTGARLDGV
jgi:carbon-monoxide dehydrogenase large subunit/6-hydroxypseudooxynicotine dehydrogenase subunit gamma